MSLSDELKAAAEQAPRSYRRLQHPKGWEPGIELSGDTGVITSEPSKGEPDWTALLAVWGLDAGEYEVVGDPQMRAWDAQTKTGIERLFYYRATIRRKTPRSDVDALLRQLRRNTKTAPKTASKAVFVAPVGDTQIGEWTAHGGTEYVIQSFYELTERTLKELKALQKLGRTGGEIILPWLGDCLQGFNSQGGRLAWRTDLTLTEQFRVYRRLLAHQIETLAPHAEKVVVVGIPGNHDEAVRQPVNTRYDDSWAIEGVITVKDAYSRLPGYDHVEFITPAIDDLTVTLDCGGTIIGMCHGHQWNGDASKGHSWWAKQAHGRTPIGDADLLLTAHRHHLHISEAGKKTHLQIPALIGNSQWWVNRHGDQQQTHGITFTVSNGLWCNLQTH